MKEEDGDTITYTVGSDGCHEVCLAGTKVYQVYLHTARLRQHEHVASGHRSATICVARSLL